MTVPLSSRRLRYLFALPGFHAEARGAEIALLAVAGELARLGNAVLVLGSGPPRPATLYDYRQVRAIDRRRFEMAPRIPPFRSETVWEDATFALGLLKTYDPGDYDVSLTCNFPFTHWALRRGGSRRPKHLFVTQNGNYPAISDGAEFRFFDCDGLVCINPDYEDASRDRWRTALIPNGIDPTKFEAVAPDRPGFGLPSDVPIVLMVSALIDTKRVEAGIRAVARLPGAHLVVAGDGPLRKQVEALAAELLPGRFTRLTASAERMPALYGSVDAFLHMSLFESFGNVFVEAMASGLPIVGHDTPRLRWIVGDRDTLCDTEDLPAVTAKLVAALSVGKGSPDPRAAQFTWPMIAQKYHAFACEVVAC